VEPRVCDSLELREDDVPTIEEMLLQLNEATVEYMEAVNEATRVMATEPFDRVRARAARKRRDTLQDQYRRCTRAVWQRRFGG
jgi:hypothetical protein